VPVRKYRTLEEMNRAQRWLPPGDPSIVPKMRYLWQLAAAFGPLCIPRGVRKYHSIEEASADRLRWEKERARLWQRTRAERKP
jgi:hypothetical protein